MNFLIPEDRAQWTTECLDDQLNDNSPVRIIDVLIDYIYRGISLKIDSKKKSNYGRPQYPPKEMLKLFIYGYMYRINSSRKLERETYINLEVMWLMGRLKPDHWTISNFRKENGDLIKEVTGKLQLFMKEKKYITLRQVGVDGTKMKAYTQKDMLTRPKIEKRLEVINEKISEYLQKIEDEDIKEEIEDEYGSEEKQYYLEKIKALQREIEKLKNCDKILEKEKIKNISSNDTDARLMKGRYGSYPGYNIQLVTDSENKLILDSLVTNKANDSNVLPELMESIKNAFERYPNEVIADKGYQNANAIQEIEEQPIVENDIEDSIEEVDKVKTYVPLREPKIKKPEVVYDAKEDMYICEMGKKIELKEKLHKEGKNLVWTYKGTECKGCNNLSICSKGSQRIIKRFLNQEWRDEYKKRMDSKEAKERLKIRKGLVEHPFGTMKSWMMGKIPLFLKGKNKVGIEIGIYVLAYNIKRLCNIIDFNKFMGEIREFNWELA